MRHLDSSKQEEYEQLLEKYARSTEEVARLRATNAGACALITGQLQRAVIPTFCSDLLGGLKTTPPAQSTTLQGGAAPRARWQRRRVRRVARSRAISVPGPGAVERKVRYLHVFAASIFLQGGDCLR